MANFGFGEARSAQAPGLNAKLSEVGGLLASAKLQDIAAIAAHRADLGACYRAELAEFAQQAPDPGRQCFQFWSMLLPPHLASSRATIMAKLGELGIGSGHYFSPHLGQQPYFRTEALIKPTPVADDVASRILSLPILDTMTQDDVRLIAGHVRMVTAALSVRPYAMPATQQRTHSTLIIGGGPAGTALLTSASRQNRLGELAASGLAIVERGATLGCGNLGNYAIRSDTTAETFLSAIKDNPEPTLAALVAHRAAMAMTRHIGALGAPLAEAGDLLAVTGERLADIVSAGGGEVLTRHDAVSARRTSAGLWATTVIPHGGLAREELSHHIVIATGGAMAIETARNAAIAGTTLGDLAGDRLVLADTVMRGGGLEAIAERMAAVRAPRERAYSVAPTT